MWEIYSKNSWLYGVGDLSADLDIVKKYSQGAVAELKPLSKPELFDRCNDFLKFSKENLFMESRMEPTINLTTDAETAYPLVHEAFYGLLCEFLEYKSEYGTDIEQEIYSGMSACDLVTRLLTKRCTSHFGRNENHLLVVNKFSPVGTMDEVSPLVMEKCLTLDEIKLAGFVLISSKITKLFRWKPYSMVMIGIPFPILNREGFFDYNDVLVTKKHLLKWHGYGFVTEYDPSEGRLKELRRFRKNWETFYRREFIAFSEVNKNHGHSKNDTFGRYVDMGKSTFLDVQNLAVRFSIISTAILSEANQRAKMEEKMAYVILDKKKIGLANSPPLYEEIFLRNLSYELLSMSGSLNNLFAIHLVGFKEIETLRHGWKMHLPNGEQEHPNEGVEIKFSKPEEFSWDKIDKKEEFVLVETYRFEGNALPGKELWTEDGSKDKKHPSVDPDISVRFIHNAHVNSTRLCGSNLRCYSSSGGVRSWKDIDAVKS